MVQNTSKSTFTLLHEDSRRRRKVFRDKYKSISNISFQFYFFVFFVRGFILGSSFLGGPSVTERLRGFVILSLLLDACFPCLLLKRIDVLTRGLAQPRAHQFAGRRGLFLIGLCWLQAVDKVVARVVNGRRDDVPLEGGTVADAVEHLTVGYARVQPILRRQYTASLEQSSQQ